MDLENEIKSKLLMRGFTKKKLLNNRGLINATIDEVAIAVVKNLALFGVGCSLPKSKKKKKKKTIWTTKTEIIERQLRR
jgi:hypothetical protein